MVFNQKNIFLFDGLGASFSSILTGLILPRFSVLIGMPIWMLHGLALLPLAYAVYSFSCYLFPRGAKRWMLLAIIFANIFYCLVSGVLIFGLGTLTGWGKILLTAEIFVVLVVVAIELSVYLSKGSGV